MKQNNDDDATISKHVLPMFWWMDMTRLLTPARQGCGIRTCFCDVVVVVVVNLFALTYLGRTSALN